MVTDPVSTEGLRAATPEDAVEAALLYYTGEPPAALAALGFIRLLQQYGYTVAALRDTGPRPDSGIETLLDDLLNVREGLVSASEAIERAIARLSTPRTETSDD